MAISSLYIACGQLGGGGLPSSMHVKTAYLRGLLKLLLLHEYTTYEYGTGVI